MRVQAHLDADANQVCIQPLRADGQAVPDMMQCELDRIVCQASIMWRRMVIPCLPPRSAPPHPHARKTPYAGPGS